MSLRDSRASRSACGRGLRETLRQENAGCDLLGLAVPIAEGRGVPLGEARDVGERLLEIAPEHERGAVEVWLAELVARRNVGDSVGEAQILKPGCLADVEMIDRMQVVVEAGCRHFLGRECAAVLQAPVHQQDVEAAARQIGAEHQAVVAGADDDPVVASIQRRRHFRTLT